MTLDEMLARDSIRYTLALYNNTGDRGAIDETVGCFTETGVLQLGDAKYSGRQSILDYFKMIMSTAYLSGVNVGPARHHTTTSRIELTSAGEAQAWTNFLLVRDGVIVQSGMYVDRFARVGEAWLLSHRRVKIEYDSLPPAG